MFGYTLFKKICRKISDIIKRFDVIQNKIPLTESTVRGIHIILKCFKASIMAFSFSGGQLGALLF